MSYYISRIQKIHTVIRITSKIQLFHPFTFSDISWKFHQNPSISFFATMYTNTSDNLDPDDPDSDPDHSPNLITCSSHHLGHLLKMSSQSIHNFLRYLSYYISWIQKIHIVIRITSKIQPFNSSLYLFRHILKISSKSVHKFFSYNVHKHIWQPGSRWSRQWSRSLPKSNHLFLAPFRSFAENVITIHP